MNKKHIIFLLALILLLGAFLRFYDLGGENLWSDEVVSVYYANKSVLEAIKWSPTIGYFPLYSMMLSLWIKIFGISEFSVRFLSAVFGTLAIYGVFQIGAFMFNKKVGIYSAIIMALSPFNVYYSQEARSYTLLILLSIYSIYFYLKYLESAKNNHMLYYIAFTLLMLNTHSPSIFILIFQNLHYFLFIRKNIKKWILVQLSLFAVLTPLIWISVGNISSIYDILIVPKPGLVTLLRTFYMFSAGLTYQPIALVFGSIISIQFALLVFLVIGRIARNIKDISYIELNKIAFLFMWLGIPIILLILQAYFYYSIYFERYVIASSAALYILIALSISRLKHIYQLISTIIIIALSLTMLYIDLEAQNRERWKDVADYIKLNKNKEDAVILSTFVAIYPFAYYFDSKCFKDASMPKFYTKIDCMSMQNIYGVRNSNEIPKEVAEKEKVFLILWNAKYIDTGGTLLKYYTANYRLTEEKDYKNIQIYTFVKNR